VDVQVSLEAPNIEMRGETVPVSLAVTSVRRLQLPEQNRDFFDRIGVDSEEDLTNNIRETLERQITYQQRQATRQQVLEKITESADWDLPEELVLRQAENALRRETLEMQQAGFTPQQVQARENEMRQNAVSTTRQALKEHFVLDKIATKENIEATPADVDGEILLMAMQSGESSRRVRARLQKTGLIENLEARLKMVEVAQTTSIFNFDDSHLARTRELVQDIQTRIDVAERLIGAERNFHDRIPLEEPEVEDVSDQITEYGSCQYKNLKVDGDGGQSDRRQSFSQGSSPDSPFTAFQ